MKKILAMLVSIVLLISSLPVLAEVHEIAGLSEKLDALYIKNAFTNEQKNKIRNDRKNDIKENLKMSIDAHVETLEGLVDTYGYTEILKGKSEEECLEYMASETCPDMNTGFLVTCLNNIYYAKQYSDNGHFDYLFSNKKYWQAIGDKKYSPYIIVDEEGNNLANKWYEFSPVTIGPINLRSETVEFLNEREKLSQMLIEKGETFVDDIKLLGIYGVDLYIKCANNEYIVVINNISITDSNKYLESFRLYLIGEFTSIVDKSRYITTPIKPTYDKEATALQEQGLLNGNENGLDLLKPLTRAEAATMLIRAIGQTEATPDNTIQTFSDVPTTFWGYGATEAAYSLGIINGVGNNLFNPNDNVTANQFSTMVLRSANESEFDWQEAVNILIEKGIITEEESSTMDFFTRGDMAKIIYEAKENNFI